jgi:superfamily I DNA and/or RNA helicase
MLRWHYRSRHESLIAVSNRQFYDNRLFIVPSPLASGGHLGLKLRYLPDGWYDRGVSRTNRVEARAVADAVVEHAINSPHLSLGVVTFSSAQRDAIIDELEVRRRDDTKMENSLQ